MSYSNQISISKSGVPILAVAILAVIFAIGLFVVGYDQGHIFSVIMGEKAFDEMLIHELTHDMRHAAGFPCH
ncbi:MAG: CbtB-domain containing protein [Thaumarchaeota archaeon]|nr:CbtB-domain containing protein [Nitrososphaerota archaeon]